MGQFLMNESQRIQFADGCDGIVRVAEHVSETDEIMARTIFSYPVDPVYPCEWPWTSAPCTKRPGHSVV